MVRLGGALLWWWCASARVWLGDAALGWPTGVGELFLTVWVPGLPAGAALHCPHSLAFVGLFVALPGFAVLFLIV